MLLSVFKEETFTLQKDHSNIPQLAPGIRLTNLILKPWGPVIQVISDIFRYTLKSLVWYLVFASFMVTVCFMSVHQHPFRGITMIYCVCFTGSCSKSKRKNAACPVLVALAFGNCGTEFALAGDACFTPKATHVSGFYADFLLVENKKPNAYC